ncbi:PIN domain-containing protein [Stenomitos frigidus]|uniref:VapC toxin family PIN domain ribonuclease n=1 Tax=Stenomitos frigidus ULC18 TaxID=2107698 RepID=A0A2T1EST2_9CYAN|nr:PIN domain-containing protein [Stenomitos frigidus]PSB35753.1 VapC toxin family PIN domain ribonuclease [Stenomitos frigidus ULC18]
MDKALLDTDILSEVLKGINLQVLARANAYLEEHGCYTLSVITVMEIVRGWHRLQRDDRIQRFLATLPTAEVLAVDTSVATLAGRLYADLQCSGQLIGVADSIIAATALQNDITLVTRANAHVT